MSRVDLRPISYTVLTLVGREGAGPHDLVRYTRHGRVYSGSAASQFYAECKRLARLGYLNAEKRPGKTRERTHYTLTEKAREALRVWAEEPCSFTGIESEAIVRLLATDLVGEARVRKSIGSLRGEIEELNSFLDEAEEAATAYPHREKYLLLNHRLARAILQAYSEWVDEVEGELRPKNGSGVRRTRRQAQPSP